MDKIEILTVIQKLLVIMLGTRGIQHDTKIADGAILLGMKTSDDQFRYYAIEVKEYGPYTKKI